MKSIILPLIFSAFFFSFIIACNDDDDGTACIDCPNPNTDTLFVNDTFLTYWHFPIGSWWVYKRIDTTAEIYDTATVVRSVYEVINNNFSEYARENYEMNIEHTYYRSAINGKKGNQFVSTDFPGDRISSVSNTSLGFDYNKFLSWPIDSLSIYEKSDGGGARSHLIYRSDTSIGNAISVDYLKIESRFSQGKDVVSIASRVGIVKFEHFNDNSQWELVNFKINN